MKIKSDILIIGSGIAGLSCAIKLAPYFDVVLITKKEISEANTRYAQGGIATVMSATDDIESHVKDTLVAGGGLCHEEVVRQIVEDGPRMIRELIETGVRFSKNEQQEYDLGREGGHSNRRILHAGDTTGAEIERALVQKVQTMPSIRIFEHHLAINLITATRFLKTSPDQCLGAYVLDTKNNIVKTFETKVTILASGGAGKVYLYTSNPDIATGDGMAMAYRAGAIMSNLEFVQFHPTCLYNPGSLVRIPKNRKDAGKTFLISEALRGEGARLTLDDGSPFMQNYHPLQELAPRDIVARAIDYEMKKRGGDYVLLDISHKDSAFIKKRFPHIYQTCLDSGFDMTQHPLPVVPAAHYFCGGIKTDLSGKTSIAGLYAVGEVACTGLHGANRLASNSLLEAVALADYVAADIKTNIKAGLIDFMALPEWDPGEATPSDEAVVITQNWDEIRRIMWNYVGIVRSNKRLERARRRIKLLKEEIREYYWRVTITSDLIELRNVADVAEMIIESALLRKESRGLHYNLDYPDLNDSENNDTEIKTKWQSF